MLTDPSSTIIEIQFRKKKRLITEIPSKMPNRIFYALSCARAKTSIIEYSPSLRKQTPIVKYSSLLQGKKLCKTNLI